MPVSTPEHDKLKKVRTESNAIGAFLDWLLHERELEICEMPEKSETYFPVHLPFGTIETLLAEYFNIDLKKIEQEKRAILAELREAQKEAA